MQGVGVELHQAPDRNADFNLFERIAKLF
jgi:hypothetical protein